MSELVNAIDPVTRLCLLLEEATRRLERLESVVQERRAVPVSAPRPVRRRARLRQDDRFGVVIPFRPKKPEGAAEEVRWERLERAREIVLSLLPPERVGNAT